MLQRYPSPVFPKTWQFHSELLDFRSIPLSGEIVASIEKPQSPLVTRSSEGVFSVYPPKLAQVLGKRVGMCVTWSFFGLDLEQCTQLRIKPAHKTCATR